MTEEQRQVGRTYEARALAAINNSAEFDSIMLDFENWKTKEGIE